MRLPARPELPGWNDLPFWDTAWPALRARLAAETRPCHPDPAQVFRALTRPPDQVRVVILGQDPYPTPGHANGLAFSVTPGTPLPRSLANIFAEIEADLGARPQNGDLGHWHDQGVMLLNTALSVPSGQAGGHARWGWEVLVRDVLARLSDRPRAFVLWGNAARALGAQVTGDGHLFVESAHPSPLSARRGFFGSRPFSRVNGWLTARGAPPIDWTGRGG